MFVAEEILLLFIGTRKPKKLNNRRGDSRTRLSLFYSCLLPAEGEESQEFQGLSCIPHLPRCSYDRFITSNYRNAGSQRSRFNIGF